MSKHEIDKLIDVDEEMLQQRVQQAKIEVSEIRKEFKIDGVLLKQGEEGYNYISEYIEAVKDLIELKPTYLTEGERSEGALRSIKKHLAITVYKYIRYISGYGALAVGDGFDTVKGVTKQYQEVEAEYKKHYKGSVIVEVTEELLTQESGINIILYWCSEQEDDNDEKQEHRAILNIIVAMANNLNRIYKEMTEEEQEANTAILEAVICRNLKIQELEKVVEDFKGKVSVMLEDAHKATYREMKKKQGYKGVEASQYYIANVINVLLSGRVLEEHDREREETVSQYVENEIEDGVLLRRDKEWISQRLRGAYDEVEYDALIKIKDRLEKVNEI